jgi:hypothetical protein
MDQVVSVELRDGSKRKVSGRVAEAIEELLMVADAINSCVKCKIIVNSAGRNTEKTIEVET